MTGTRRGDINERDHDEKFLRYLNATCLLISTYIEIYNRSRPFKCTAYVEFAALKKQLE